MDFPLCYRIHSAQTPKDIQSRSQPSIFADWRLTLFFCRLFSSNPSAFHTETKDKDKGKEVALIAAEREREVGAKKDDSK
jgi:hypothetical protein